MLHLLKASSKPVPESRKRRKIELAGTPAQWKDHLAQTEAQSVEHHSVVMQPANMEEIKTEQQSKDEESAFAEPRAPIITTRRGTKGRPTD